MTLPPAPARLPLQHAVIGVLLFLLMLPVTAMVPVLSALTVERHPGIGDFARHLFMSVNMLGALLAAPLAGWLSDRSGQRVALIIAALALNALSLFLLGLPHSYPATLLLRFIEGCAHIGALSLLMTLAADHARSEGLGATMGGVGAAISLGVAAGAPFGGWIGAHDATLVPTLGAALIAALTVAAALLLRDADRPAARERRSPLAALAMRRALALPYAFAFIDRFTVGFIVSTVSLYFAGVLQLGPARIGLAMAAFLLPFSLLTWPAGVLCRRIDSLALMLAGSALYGLFLIALPWTGEASLLPVMAIGGSVAALMYAPSLVLTARLAPPDARALSVAGFNVAGSAGFALGPLVAGALLALLRTIGVDSHVPVFAFFGLCEIALVLALLPHWWRTRHHTTSNSLKLSACHADVRCTPSPSRNMP